MGHGRRSGRIIGVATLAASLLLGGGRAGADTVILKNGVAYKGTVDRDNTTISVYDGLKRIVFRDNRIERIDSDPGYSRNERFQLVQPLEVHAGVMPHAAVNIQSTPWDAKGRRSFRYLTQKPGKGMAAVEMQQAINELTPHMVKYRGIDGFWLGQVATSQVPRPMILGLLGRVDQADQEQRLKVARWLIQAEWFPEAREALDGLARDFADLAPTVADVRNSIAEMEARESLAEARVRRQGNQPVAALARLRAIPEAGLPESLLEELRAEIRAADDRLAADRTLAADLRSLADSLPEEDRKAWKVHLAEVLEGLSQAPEVARPRLEPPAPASPAPASAAATVPPDPSPAARFARKMSGWVVGEDAATEDLRAALAMWKGRDAAQAYLSESDPMARETLLADLVKYAEVDRPTMERIIPRMPPPLRDRDRAREAAPGVKIRRVAEDENPVPSEYAVLLPPEYHPLRSYPAVVVLHDGKGPLPAIDLVAEEAARRGYIAIAPEYAAPGKLGGDPASVILALRDARKRYAIDSDRVFLLGQLDGGTSAWEIGLGHPDTFAGVVSLSGFPARYAYRYTKNAEQVPLYVALGELAPGAREVVFDTLVKKQIDDVQDVTYVDYLKRGYESFPEEIPPAFDWMDRRRRDPAPKGFELVTARDTDDRFFGVVVRDFVPGRVTAPEAADPLGKNLRPATLKVRTTVQGNQLTLTTSGIQRMDVWLSSKLLDPNRTIQVRINGSLIYRGQPAANDLAPMLEDVRVRGDRQQLYFLKIAADGPRTRIR
ncbi:alpha/beta hydrolase [Tundrisphaera sp. TA3]|uniref:carboxylesterase family protein n=1 Tax=Tundrisphaera sp. TA3 TaxID=3435775 RepID=UPI003EB6B9F5